MFKKFWKVLISSFCCLLLFSDANNSYGEEKIYTHKELVRKESVLYDKITDTKIYGLIREYSPASGKLLCETPYKNGKENGIKKCFSHAGNLYNETPYNDGKTNGVGKVFYESGKIFSETPYINGKVHGVLKRFYESGNIFGETPYKDGQIDGVHQFFYESGKLKSKTSYKNGKRDGVEVRYRRSGYLFQEIIFEDGVAVSGFLNTFWGNKRRMSDSELQEINSEQNEY
ncbi:MAG: toxin-antitoxin system YwqK family antitoxin [Desulforhopalus sp.]|nr:toxin-antitoxin system YwqK family antitoxin [Desulforhopalus sp.]